MLAVGFAATLTVSGLIISAGAHQLISAAPWLGFIVGVLLVVFGLLGLVGRGPQLRLRLPAMRGPRRRSGTGTWWWLLFGVGYAAASLACTFGVLLAVIAQAQATTGLAGQAVVFTAYAAGSVTLLLLLSTAAALAGTAVTRAIHTVGRWQSCITAALLLVTGAYLAAYWWPAITHHAPTGHGFATLDHWSAAASTWLQQHTTAAAITAASVLATVGLARAATRTRRHQAPRGPAATPPTSAAARATHRRKDQADNRHSIDNDRGQPPAARREGARCG